MSRQMTLSRRTQTNWLIDATLFLGGLLAALSGIYFLYLPSGGYQGGRNPMYGVTVLFGRHTWDTLHTWAGVAMIVAAAIHLLIHWSWVVRMARLVVSTVRPGGSMLPRNLKLNLAVNTLIAVSFVLCAVSGVYFLLLPEGGLGRTTWDLIHTWSGVALITAAAVHLYIHWRWVKNVARRFFRPGGQKLGLNNRKWGSSSAQG